MFSEDTSLREVQNFVPLIKLPKLNLKKRSINLEFIGLNYL